MRFSFSGSNEVTASRPVVWQHLLDPQFVAASAPGVEKVEQVDEAHFQVFLAVGLGALKVHFTLEVRFPSGVSAAEPENVIETPLGYEALLDGLTIDTTGAVFTLAACV